MTDLLVVTGLSKRFRRARHEPDTVAVDDVSLRVGRGETLALVGESGAGKSTLGRLVLRLIEPDTGTVTLDGVEISGLPAAELRRRRRDMQMVFQDPYTSLDPRYTIQRSVAEPLDVHADLGRAERDERVEQTLAMVGLNPTYLGRVPHQMSGGELQRAAIARALVLEPKLIVLDEPVAALDVSIRAQILNLLLDIQASTAVSYLYITHDLATVRLLARSIAVMRHGRIVEQGETDEVMAAPAEAYTRELLAAVPTMSVAGGASQPLGS